jgi:DNA segregation ATPase FtsK/SpoIIIE, S-DNA-T family
VIKEYLHKRKAKNKLMRAFRQGNIYLKYERNEKHYFIFPKIHSVMFKDTHTEYFFMLPVGVDPSLLEKKLYVFRQLFGEHIEIEKIKDDKAFTLKIYNSGLPSFVPFDYEAFKTHSDGCELPVIMGTDQSGKLNIFDLKKSHHVQITGITNTGKSVYLRAILTALTLHFSPKQIHFYLADLKRTELTLFKKLQHTKKTVTNVSELELMLLEVLQEVEKRYSLMERYEVAHIDDVNKIIIEEPFPYIVVMIDEYGLCSDSEKILKLVQDITSIARAANVYLFLSLQRADSTTITGIAKNNLGVKISFKQSNGINAKIAGVEGVENLKLSDKGRCLMDIGSDIKTIQCPFISVEQTKELIKPFTIDKPTKAHTSQNGVFDDYSNIFEVLDNE